MSFFGLPGSSRGAPFFHSRTLNGKPILNGSVEMVIKC